MRTIFQPNAHLNLLLFQNKNVFTQFSVIWKFSSLITFEFIPAVMLHIAFLGATEWHENQMNERWIKEGIECIIYREYLPFIPIVNFFLR